MKYLLLINNDETEADHMAPEDLEALMSAYDTFHQEITKAGVLLGGERLQPTATARLVRVNGDGQRVVTDGPFTETKEQLGGFFMVDVATEDEAIGWAAKIPHAARAHIEVRPVWCGPEDGDGAA